MFAYIFGQRYSLFTISPVHDKIKVQKHCHIQFKSNLL